MKKPRRKKVYKKSKALPYGNAAVIGPRIYYATQTPKSASYANKTKATGEKVEFFTRSGKLE